MILAGDVGGTKTLLALFSDTGDIVREQLFASADYQQFDHLLAEFLDGESPDAGAIGVAGPVREGRCQTTNLPWFLAEEAIARQISCSRIWLLNDLAATAWGLLSLPASAFAELSEQAPVLSGHKAVLAAGTGLGEAIMAYHPQHHAYQVLPTEGGHCDFAPNDDLEIELLRFLRQRFPDHVSNERLICGQGLIEIYRFLRGGQSLDNLPDPAAAISEWALSGQDKVATEALTVFCRLYGAEAGNLALKCLPSGGVYLAGGIAPKILPFLRQGAFMSRFVQKGRYRDYLATVPVKVCLEPKAALLGAADFTRRRLQEQG